LLTSSFSGLKNVINLNIKIVRSYTSYMVIGTRLLKDKQNLPKPIHHQQEAGRVAYVSRFPPMQTHHVGFLAGQLSNR